MNKSNRGKNSAKNGEESNLILDDDGEEVAPIDEIEFHRNHSVVGSVSHTASATENVMVVDEVDDGSNINGGIFGAMMDLYSICNWGGDDGGHTLPNQKMTLQTEQSEPETNDKWHPCPQRHFWCAFASDHRNG